eukprot:CAMPEP_0201687474 /NCGR_PEP_ID=MMETSP0578-20130828/1523_1 /ASSEMBLY_ACC=CAM_ASM_000663 /TAXON_ID=267565 /ORGANISM="Skeletonema grethea, Strain CCMP 1804" /LENGTH=235 /DNA_ID=CAMNT_0048171633 /DNA_START=97 /DNA_END=801 /DNA_ORIENTATION=-
MPITEHQQELLSRHGANYTDGLSTSEASIRRNSSRGGLNKVQKPINCPSWVCCLLPCINHIPSMKQFRYVQPDDAEVLRDGRWIRYDAASLVVGDIVRLAEGDVVPADCVVISLGMEHVDASIIVGDEEEDVGNTTSESLMDLTVDSHYITGETKPRHIPCRSNQTVQSTLLYYGSRVLEGACIALVTECGERTILAKLIKEGRWPPKGDLSDEVEETGRSSDDYDSSGIALVQR